MIKQTVTYKDYDGVEQTEDFFFHMSKTDIVRLELSHQGKGGLEETLTKIMEAKDGETIMKEFEKILHMSVGRKSEDGKKFIRDDETRSNFFETNAYEALFMKLVTNADFAAEFIRGIAPADMIEEAAKAVEVAKAQLDSADLEKPAPRTITRAELISAEGDEFKNLTEKIATGEVVVEG